MDDDPMRRAQMRRVSRVIFKHTYKLELMIAVAREPSGRVCLIDLTTTLGIRSPSNLQDPLKDLVNAGLLTRLPSSDSRRQFYRREESIAWQWAEELFDTCMGLTLID